MGKYGITARVIGPDGAGEIVDKRKGERLVRYDDIDLPVTWVAKSDLSIETWVPKVGDRVRSVDNDSTEYVVDAVRETELDVTSLNKDGTRSFRYPGSRRELFLPVEPLPVAAEAQPVVEAPAGLQIEAGRYYKTRDGRKVGPMVWRNTDRWGSAYTGDYPWTDDPSDPNSERTWQVDGFQFYTGDTDNNDLVAEWVDEPVVAVEEVAVAEATTTPTFKVGDRVRYVGRSASYSDPWMIGLEGVVTAFAGTLVDVKWDSVYVDGKCTGGAKYPDNIELVSVAVVPANDNLVVTITAKNESVADALRTIAAALNAA